MNRIWICEKDQLKNGDYFKIEVSYARVPSSVIIFRYQNQYLAYQNLCVHMPRALDCESNTIFDDSRKNLRCSMHGIHYDPLTGESLSTICNGQKLTPVKLLINDDGIWINDKHVKPLVETNH